MRGYLGLIILGGGGGGGLHIQQLDPNQSQSMKKGHRHQEMARLTSKFVYVFHYLDSYRIYRFNSLCIRTAFQIRPLKKYPVLSSVHADFSQRTDFVSIFQVM